MVRRVYPWAKDSALLLDSNAVARSSRRPECRQKIRAAVVKLAQSAAARALDFEHGNLQSLLDARDDFTLDGWNDFMKHMRGYVDAKGVPQFSQSFVPSGDAKVIDEESGIVHLTILGRLKQTHDSSSTTYDHVEIDVRVGGTPIKIQHLEPTIVVRRPE